MGIRGLAGLFAGLLALSVCAGAGATTKKRIFVVSSYHPEYLWSQSTQEGLVQAMLDYGYLDDAAPSRTASSR